MIKHCSYWLVFVVMFSMLVSTTILVLVVLVVLNFIDVVSAAFKAMIRQLPRD